MIPGAPSIHQRAWDGLVVAMVTVVSLPWAMVPDLEPLGVLDGVLPQIGCIAVAGVVFTVWRRHPMLCAAVGLALELLTGSPVGVVVAAFGIPLHTRHRWTWLAALFLCNIVAILLANNLSLWSYRDVVDGELALVAAAVAGWFVRQTTQINVLLRERADQADQLAVQASRQAVHDERDRLAAELHDTISYQLNVMMLHAGVVDTSAGDPDTVRRSAYVIQTAAGAAVRELHVLLRYLPEQSGVENDNRYLRAIPAIARDLHAAGHPVTVRLLGTPRLVPDEVDLAAYRVAQEALTNSTKYAPGAPTTITIRFEPATLDLSVENESTEGGAKSGYGTGLGLKHLRSRVAAAGGHFTASADHDGQFQVRARFPLTPPSDDTQ